MEQARQDFIESMGRHFEEEGAPRIAGRLFALLMVNEAPCSLDDIAEQLQASKGSASTNARLLERLGVAERVSRPGDRRDYYRVAEDMGERMLALALERIGRMIQRLRRGADTIPLAPAVARRFDETIRFHERARGTIEQVLERMRARDHHDDQAGRETAPEAR